ncbi:MAG: TetR family transcriptional regulator [Anaerolineae bacterium]|nr:TetR family transcriptional regulator [Anaerolineae bacterium]
MSSNGTKTRRTEIVAAAERLFRDKGYLATTMRDIADEMGMQGGGSLYAHISGKEELLWHIASEAIDAFFAAVIPAIEQAGSNSPADKLQAAMLAHMGVICERLSAAAVYFDEWRHLSQPKRGQFLERRNQYERIFEALVLQGVQSSVFRQLDVRVTTLHLLGSMNAIRHWYRPDGRLSAQEVAARITDLLLEGIHTR